VINEERIIPYQILISDKEEKQKHGESRCNGCAKKMVLMKNAERKTAIYIAQRNFLEERKRVTADSAKTSASSQPLFFSSTIRK
jgi:hypothetical protein